MFAVINLIIYNYIQAYFSELIAWCRQNIPNSNKEKQVEDPKKSNNEKEVNRNIVKTNENINNTKESKDGVSKNEKA